MRSILLTLTLLACTANGAGDDSDSPSPTPARSLTLAGTEDLNAVVATKGMDVGPDGSIAVWNYNQDQLEIWDGAVLDSVASGLVTSFGTDLAIDSAGDVFVSKGDSGAGDVIAKWSANGVGQWGTDGLLQLEGTWLGLDVQTVDGVESLWACDAEGEAVVAMSSDDGTEHTRIPVDGIPIDVAVSEDGRVHVLTSTSTNPVGDDTPVALTVYADDGRELYGPAPVAHGTYLTVTQGIVAVSVNDWDASTRSVAVFSSDLAERIDTPLPASYIGFAGGIAAHDGRIYVAAQEGTGSGPICDVLVYE